jgi:hypothetical protein
VAVKWRDNGIFDKGNKMQQVFTAIALTPVRAGDIVSRVLPGMVHFDRRPSADNPCTAESLVCTRSAGLGDLCEYVVNGPIERDE